MRRTAAREIAVRLCFALTENPCDAMQLINSTFEKEYYSTLQEEDGIYRSPPDSRQLDYITRIVTGVLERTGEIDGYIEKYSVGWKFNRISKTATAIMRIAMFEVLYMPEVPERAAINEAIELARRYETPETRAFINGILGSFSRSEIKNSEPQAEGAAQEAAEAQTESGTVEDG